MTEFRIFASTHARNGEKERRFVAMRPIMAADGHVEPTPEALAHALMTRIIERQLSVTFDFAVYPGGAANSVGMPEWYDPLAADELERFRREMDRLTAAHLAQG